MADNLPDIENWRIDPNQYLGHDFEDFQNTLQAFSLTSPKGYLMMKSEVAKKLKRDAIRNLYNTMFTVFQKGLDGNGRPLFVIDGEVRLPRYPLGHTNEFVLSASETMDSILKKMLEILMPERYTQLTAASLGKIGNSAILDNH